jgi:dTDP-4-dehydrorhamnose 3,5-epimerase
VTFTVEPTSLKGALIITPQHYGDGRGFFKEVFRADELGPARLGVEFVQDNVSLSHRGVLRGLHMVDGMAKLVQVISGATYHVIADMRPDSTTYLKWEAFELSGENHRQVFVPDGFANGFYVLSDAAYVYYKQNVYYDPAKEQIVRWDDPALGVKWPTQSPLLSGKDRAAADYRR